MATLAPLTSLLATQLCSLTTPGKHHQIIAPEHLRANQFHSHYIENTGDEDLVWIELYKSDRVADISLQQWLALTPADIVANVLNVDIDFVETLKKEKLVLIA
jgi:hypothetical protein